MVIRACGLLAATTLFLASGAVAQTADWDRSGGALFVGQAEASATSEDAASTVALSPPAQPYAEAVAQAADRHGVDPKLLHALVVVESAYRPTACSPAGACGLTQLMPATATELGVTDRMEPVASLNGGADYLAQQLQRFRDLRLALAAYNAGPHRVERLGRIPDFPETQGYVVSVVDCYLALTAGRSIRTANDCRPAGGAR